MATNVANYGASILQLGVAKVSQQYANAEMRFNEPKVLKLLMSGNELSDPSNDELMKREDRAYQAEFLTRNKKALGTGRSVNYTGTKSGSAVVTPTFETVNTTFQTSLKQMDNKTLSFQEAFDNELRQSVINMSEGLEEKAVAFLAAEKSLVNPVDVEGTFNGTTNVFEITNSISGDYAMQISLDTMVLLKYKEPCDIFCDSISFRRFQQLNANGNMNAVNTAFQFQYGNHTIHAIPEFNDVASALSYTKGYWQIAPKGTLQGIDWIPVQNRQGISSQSIGGTLEYGSMINPIDGITLAVNKRWTATDDASTGGYAQDVIENVEISTDISFNSSPISGAAGETTVYGFALV